MSALNNLTLKVPMKNGISKDSRKIFTGPRIILKEPPESCSKFLTMIWTSHHILSPNLTKVNLLSRNTAQTNADRQVFAPNSEENSPK